MRKTFIILLLILGVSCSQETPVAPDAKQSTFMISLPDGLKDEWKSGDKVSVISMKSGAIATIDTFVAKEDGSTAGFAGNYTGSPNASLQIVYPALEKSSDKIYESSPLYGNENGFFRAVEGTSYILFAPNDGMTFMSQNTGPAGLEPLCFMVAGCSANKLLEGETVSLEERISVIRLNLDASSMGNNETVKSVSLAVDNGKPFTSYRGSMSLSGSLKYWVTGEPRERFELSLEGVTSGKSLSFFIPVFPNSEKASLSTSTDSQLAITVRTENRTS